MISYVNGLEIPEFALNTVLKYKSCQNQDILSPPYESSLDVNHAPLQLQFGCKELVIITSA